MDEPILPIGTLSTTASHNIPALDPNSYTAHRLKHATPEHIHLTARRFFIGPIPEGWLSSNRKSWYKRRLELSTYSSRSATFHAAAGQTYHHRTGTNLSPVIGRTSFSFPQPEDVDEEEGGVDGEEAVTGIDGQLEAVQSQSQQSAADESETEDDTEDDEWFEPAELLPVSTDVEREPHYLNPEQARAASVSRSQEASLPVRDSDPSDVSLTADASKPSPTNTDHDRRRVISFSPEDSPRTTNTTDNRISSSTTTPSERQEGLNVQRDSIDAGSKTRLIPSSSPDATPKNSEQTVTSSGGRQKSLSKHDPLPVSASSNQPFFKRKNTEGVRFKVGEAVVDRQQRIGKHADSAKHRVSRRLAKRQTLQEGTIIKMQKMLVRVDLTSQQVPDNYDENESIKLTTYTLEKWREFMVVIRKSKKSDEDDFRLQFYKTRVIPEIDDNNTKRKPTREIRLIPKTTHINLYSSLDKSVVLWHPYKKGTRLVLIKCESAAYSTEWFTFLKDVLGWKRPTVLQVSVPDLDVKLQIEKPFDIVRRAAQQAQDEETGIAKAEEAEEAVAAHIISECFHMLKSAPQWTDVLDQWTRNHRPGLAWKRYDRLEWIHGVNEKNMYGTMAMQHSYELELRPRMHYPQHAAGKKGKDHDEPAPIEGFLIRMTSQKGIHRRMGKAFFKRLYFATYDHLLVFNRPAQATPPHPPKLQTVSGSNIPTSREILNNIPIMYEIDPFPLIEAEDSMKEIKWLASGNRERIQQRDLEAVEEAARNDHNLSMSDGYINMTRIRKVRKMKWGADDIDQELSSGSDVDFHESVNDTSRPDGVTSHIDDDRIFELLLDNGLVVRLQAYDKQTRDEWMSRLKKLVKYWKLRKSAEIDTFKSVRATNLRTLKIDENMEAELGQFGHKWEVTHSAASPELYNICSLASCRNITLSGLLYRKARRHGTFQRCGVVLTGGKMLIYQSTLRKTSGAQIANIHQDKQQIIDLKGCYVYSGLIVEDDLLYQNRTFDANNIGTMASLPRVWTEDGWTSTDVDVMCCFVVWMNTRKGWFRTAGNTIFGNKDVTNDDASQGVKDGKGTRRARLKRVRQLGVPGRGIVFKCRSRAERDLWVLNLNIEIEKLVEQQQMDAEEAGGEVRLAS